MHYFMLGLLRLFVFFIYISCGSKEEVKEKPSVTKSEVIQPEPITIPEDVITTKSGLKYINLAEGEGNVPEAAEYKAL